MTILASSIPDRNTRYACLMKYSGVVILNTKSHLILYYSLVLGPCTLHLMYKFSIDGLVVSCIEAVTTFQHTLQFTFHCDISVTICISFPFPLLLHTHPEEYCSICQNVRTASAHDTAKLQ
jgi:hypothetical protein